MFDVTYAAFVCIPGLKPQAGSSWLYAVLQQCARQSEEKTPSRINCLPVGNRAHLTVLFRSIRRSCALACRRTSVAAVP